MVVGKRSREKINKLLRLISRRVFRKHRAIHFIEHIRMFYKTSRPIKRGESVCRSNALCRPFLSLVTWPHLGRLNSLIQRSRLNSNYLKQKQAQTCLRKCQQAVVTPVSFAELEQLHHFSPLCTRDRERNEWKNMSARVCAKEQGIE